MNVKSEALRVLGTIGGVLFSIALIIALIGSLVFSVSTAIVKPETIITFVKEANLAEQILSNEEIQTALKEQGINADIVTDLVDSSFFQDTIEVYTDEIVAAIQGQQAEVVLSEDLLKQFAGEHMDTLVQIAEQHLPEDAQLDTQQIETAVNNLVDEYGSALVQALPSGQQVQEMLVESEIQKPAELLVSTTVPVVLYSIIGVLALLVFVCLLHKFRGLLCLGIDALITAAILLAPYLALTNNALIASLPTGFASLIAPLIAVLSARLGIYLIVLTVVGVLFIAGYITYTVRAKKKAAAGAETLPEATEPAPAE